MATRRRRVSGQGHGRSQAEIDALAMAVAQRLRELSVAGVAPSMREYEAERGDAPALTMLAQYKVRFGELVRLAGLRMRSAADRRRLRDAHQVPEELEEEIRAAFAAQAEATRYFSARPMEAIPTGIDVRYVLVPGLPAGCVYRVTSYRASLR